MPWQMIPIRLTYTRTRWRRLLLFLIGLTVVLSLINLWTDLNLKCTACRSVHLFHRQYVELDFDYKKYINATWEARVNNDSLLTLFTTWNPSMQKPVVYHNALRNWASLSRSVTTLVYSNDSEVENIAKKHNWQVQKIDRTACFGTPVLRTMFQEVIGRARSKFYGYANADLVFNDGLVKTLEAVANNPEFSKGPLLIVGKRVDVNISKLQEPVINGTKDVEKLAPHGKLSWGFAGDYYITNELFPWEFVPDLVIGRPLVDNWLIWYAREVGAKVVDASGSILAVHQLANGLKRIKFMCNKAEMWKKKLLPNLPVWKGMIDCAGYESRVGDSGKVFILPKIFLPEICNHDEAIFH
ncbi:uncharacterized protein LOC117340335 [Pecten maximus]|uniref:uncharacterized protein LOC117340335 n=1 Tax=Pecten maximus TaxID=6579 RepID=UPI001458B382|nr:uncharacterized protein LOC117340335 [Pecten maximus]XP_033757990.1 uncharacterized protein LOC117340335 [Pecten maximus]